MAVSDSNGSLTMPPRPHRPLRRLSLLATGSSDTVRNMRRGSSPRLDSLEALCRVLSFRLEIVPLDEAGQPPAGDPIVEKRPEWSRRLREEIRRDLLKILNRGNKGEP